MVDKKGYIKTLEAVIAIIMIVIISYTLIPRPAEAPPDVPLIVKGSQKIIDQTIQLNETMRNLITKKPKFEDLLCSEKEEMLTGVKAIIDYYVLEQNIIPGYDYTCAICSKPGECLACMPPGKGIYMTDVIIGSSETQQNPKVVRIWLWRKPTPQTDDANDPNWWPYNKWLRQCKTTCMPCDPFCTTPEISAPACIT